ncbi:MAG TPA: ArgE/DapE family deacylase [bacterium]|nr:ArgE/DapE family deacylase [bacterium]
MARIDAPALTQDIDRHRSALVGLLASLVRADTSNPPGDTRGAVDLAAARFRALGLDTQILADDPKKPNLLLRLGGGRPELLFNTHVDTVPFGDRATWRHDPLGAEIVGGQLYGRGAGDPKGSAAAMVAAVETLARLQVDLRGSLLLSLVSDEEVGGAKGTDMLVQRGLLRPDQVIIGEMTDNRIAIAEKGVLWVRLVTRGRTAHGSTPWKGVNAIQSMVRVLSALDAEIGARLATMSHPLTPPPSLSVGTIEGGIATNVVPDHCEATIDRRTLPHESPQDALTEIDRVLARLREEDPHLEVTVEPVQTGPPVETSPDAPLVRSAQEVAASMGLDPAPVGYQQASDGRFFSARGIDTILFGPGAAELAHAPDEYIDLDAVATAAVFYAQVAARLLAPA